MVVTVKKVPVRTCVACMTARPKRELIRVVRRVDGSLEVDRRGKVSGRGAYLCPTVECLDRALQGHRLERTLKVEIGPEVLAQLRQAMEVLHD